MRRFAECLVLTAGAIEFDDARAQLRAAERLVAPLGSGPLVERISSDLESAGSGTTLPSTMPAVELTERERDVVALVRQGYTNREVAETLFRLRLPMAARYVLRAYQNELLIMVKSTSAVSAITLTDLTAAANAVFDYTYDPFTPLVTAAGIYWCIVNVMRGGFTLADRRLNRHLARS